MEVSLPELIAQTNMDQQSVSKLRDELAKMTGWLSKNADRWFTAEYESPSPVSFLHAIDCKSRLTRKEGL